MMNQSVRKGFAQISCVASVLGFFMLAGVNPAKAAVIAPDISGTTPLNLSAIWTWTGNTNDTLGIPAFPAGPSNVWNVTAGTGNTPLGLRFNNIGQLVVGTFTVWHKPFTVVGDSHTVRGEVVSFNNNVFTANADGTFNSVIDKGPVDHPNAHSDSYSFSFVRGKAGNGTFTLKGVHNPTPIPTPALLPGLIGVGLATWRKQRQDVVAQSEV